MFTITEKEFKKDYLFYKELNGDKNHKTYCAMKESSNGIPLTFVIKETDEKAAQIYEMLSKMWNPHIAETYGVFKILNTETGRYKYAAVTEYVFADGCDFSETLSLAQFIKRNGIMTKKTALAVCVQLCNAVCDFHKKGGVHRDLKPENIMISDYDTENPKIKIVDFGSAKVTKSKSMPDTTVVGTLGYQAPETLSSQTTNRTDIYSIGCILNFMLTGQEPGIKRYKENHYIAAVIEKATNEDFSHRYSSVTSMKKELNHLLGVRLIDRIPIIRALPGFRTDTVWKGLIGAFAYISMAYLCVVGQDILGGIFGMLEILIFYMLAPMIWIFNMGNLLRFIPEYVRHNNIRFLLLRVIAVLFCFFAPMVAESVLGW